MSDKSEKTSCSIRLPAECLNKVKALAQQEKRTISGQVEHILSEYLKERQ